MKLNFRATGKRIAEATKSQLAKLATNKFMRYAAHIRKVRIDVDEQPCQRHGVLTICKVEVLLPGLPSVSVRAKGKNMMQVIKRALRDSELLLARQFNQVA
ncbi:hypothetical protein PRUB_b0555 [Pseudoalteromonas rubra]|uniref:Uncharacterized protein n=1 Tax=Pseudoalteromonas rubra TaxID=43658 RepID=A0A8T0BZK4_9GAMM|nr:hypothetical protein [Pseudoalteromonas rubra]KAF7781363.1 hypothetical protein PRUB_b0555 [Pseudoalteromonas rubra]